MMSWGRTEMAVPYWSIVLMKTLLMTIAIAIIIIVVQKWSLERWSRGQWWSSSGNSHGWRQRRWVWTLFAAPYGYREGRRKEKGRKRSDYVRLL